MSVPVVSDVAAAAAALRAGGLVAFPTETVYGLGADAADPHAVARVYAVKGRPADHPLIVHLAGARLLDRWAVDVPAYAYRLAAALWPGPLTLVLRRGPSVGDHVTGGQDTVGLRVPDHPVALALLAEAGLGVAAPSANRFGRVSPTSAGHVVAELGDRLDPATDLVLDGGACRVGIESTIVDATGAAPRLLRPGAVDLARITAVGGVPPAAAAAAEGPAVRAPGMLAAHYAPRAAVLVVAAGAAVPPAARGGLRGLVALAAVPTPDDGRTVRLAAPADPTGYARVLYAALREADALGLAEVLAVPPADDGGLGTAVRDRLARAAAGSRR